MLDRAGATVYVTGRSAGEETTENLPGTIGETAEAVTAQGGTGSPVRCDHAVDAEVDGLFARVRGEQGRLDLLVNNVWGGYEHHEGEGFVAPFWEQPLRHWEGMFVAGVRAHLVASRFAVPLMLQERRGLISTPSRGRSGSTWATCTTMWRRPLSSAWPMEWPASSTRTVSPPWRSPGFMRTERVMAAHAAQPFDLSATETPEYLGQAVAALAADPDVLQRSGEVLTVGDLAREYGFTDVDGRQPPAFRL